ncbi:hypothetical protein ACXZ1K_18720 [Pedobacter sp. PWIIR3]
MLNKTAAVLLLLLFISMKCTVLFVSNSHQPIVAWQSDHDDESGDQQEDNKEPKQFEKLFDEFLQSEHLTTFNIPSIKLRPEASLGTITEFLSSPDLPPEVRL